MNWGPVSGAGAGAGYAALPGPTGYVPAPRAPGTGYAALRGTTRDGLARSRPLEVDVE